MYDCILNTIKCKEPTSRVVDTFFGFVQYSLSANCKVWCCRLVLSLSFYNWFIMFSHTFCVPCILFPVCMCLFVSCNWWSMRQ